MLSDFFKGLGAYSKAFSLVSELRLWKFLLLPGVVGLGLALMIGGTAWTFYAPLAAFLFSFLPDFGGQFLIHLTNVISGLLIVSMGILVFKHLLMVLVSPFMSPLSERVEKHLTGMPGRRGTAFPQVMKDLMRGLRIAFRNIFREILWSIPLLILSLIPGVGIIGAVGLFLVQAFYAGFGNIDYTLERHYNVSGSVRFVRQNRGLALGNGTPFVLLLSTGIGAFIAPPLATIAATVETVKRLGTPMAPLEIEKTEYV